MDQVPYIVYEGAEARSERMQKRLVIALIIAVVAIFVSNAVWLYAWCQYDYVGEDDSIEISQDSRGLSNINLGSQGDVTDGANSIDSTPDECSEEEGWEGESDQDEET